MTQESIVKPEWIEGYQDGVSLPDMIKYLPDMRECLRDAADRLGRPGAADEIIRKAEKSSIPFDVFCSLLLALIDMDEELQQKGA